jgi:hypothetical protein
LEAVVWLILMLDIKLLLWYKQHHCLMKSSILSFSLLCLLCLLCFFAHAQTCASPFAAGTVTFNETCTPTGADNYAIIVTATSDSTLQFQGLWREQQAINADVDCNTQTFAIPRQLLLVGYEIQGRGDISGNFVQVFYGMHETSTGNLVDSCAGLYQVVIVGTRTPVQSQLLVYPNPAGTQAHLQWTGVLANDAKCNYRILDMQGRVVDAGGMDANLEANLDLSMLSKGVYRVVAMAGDGTTAHKTLVIQ